MQHAKLIIFDLDGTLVEFEKKFLFDLAVAVSKLKNLPLPGEHILNETFSNFDFFGFVPNEFRKDFIESFWGLFSWDTFPKPKAFEYTIPSLESLRRNQYQLALVTSRLMEKSILEDGLDECGILDNLSHVLCRTSRETHWSDKTHMLRQTIETFEVSPSDCIMVGDIPADIESAREVGIPHTVAVLSGGISPKILTKSNPTWLLSDVGEFVQRMNR